ncbi:MAG TPA: hypothetical protein VM143_12195 [Acidimicrobiales bacterium]|nr:hypothetical protein [Acidimicrobiales bacterium]
MTPNHWHPSPEQLARFATGGDALDEATAASIEAHVVRCEDCRMDLARAADPNRLAASWAALADRIDQPRRTLMERAMNRLGVSSGWSRILAATPGLRASGLAAVALVGTAAALASRQVGAEGPFLAVAPLLPLAAVAASFASAEDPAGEAAVATPLHGAGLMVRRTVAVLLLTFSLLGLSALALPELGAEAAAWILPALALSIAALALSTWARLESAVAMLGGGWLMAVSTLWWVSGHGSVNVESAPFLWVTQSLAFATAVFAALIVSARRDRFATLEVFQ